MAEATQFPLFEDFIITDDWTFKGAKTRESSHCYHDYPARMIPQIAGKLLDKFAVDANLLFDPYSGTGTSLVEGMVRGINVIGTDLNPLARLIAKAKVSTPNIEEIETLIFDLTQEFSEWKEESNPQIIDIPGISRVDFWFKPIVIQKLGSLKEFINNISNDAVREFFQVAFSETARESSNTRSSEFKLYRYSAEKLETHNPDVFGIMISKLHRNMNGLKKYLSKLKNLESVPKSSVFGFNTMDGIPEDKIKPSSVDIVITSPPYGDSHTTVAYGQYSRLSSAWLDFEEPGKVDSKLMGGKIANEIEEFPSEVLNSSIARIADKDKKRAREVVSFYTDLILSISNISQVIKQNGYACYVVGNRTVKGVTLPTDQAIKDFFENYGFSHVETFTRSIPNKRMPLKNSPSNVAGNTNFTMNKEYIVVMKRDSL